MDVKSSASNAGSFRTGIGLALALLVSVLVVLFYGCFLPGHTLFSNDGPLAIQMAACNHLPEIFTGSWQDLNTIGTHGGGAWPDITYGVLFLLGPVGYGKFCAPIALLLLGLGAWCYFRQLGLSRLACILGGFAAMLNSIFFSTACWGVAAHPITAAMAFFALSALCDTTSSRQWLRVAVAGLAIGVGVADGADIGAIFSLYVALYLVYQAVINPGARAKQVVFGISRVALVAIFAAFFAAQSISVLVGTQIQGVDTQTKEQHWDWATQWSFPKREALGILVPGLFGYRMDAPQGLPEYLQESYAGGNYWGAAGRDPNWDRYFANGSQGNPPQGIMRFSGGGAYAGVLVLLVAIWAAVQAFRKDDSVFSLGQRKQLWFWVITAVAGLLLAFGRYAPFYKFIYALPYLSTIRNPAKYLYIFSFALVVLFAYGIDALNRRNATMALSLAAGGFKNWWAKAAKFDRRWVLGCLVAFGVCVVGWLAYASHRQDLERYLTTVQFPHTLAHDIAGFSINQVGWFLIFFAAGIALFIAALSGRFAGPRLKWGGVLLGLFLVIDLGRANLPWILFVDYANENEVSATDPNKSSDPVIEFLRQQPYEHRVSMAPYNASGLGDLYRVGWMQRQFQYFNIQCLDIVQMPRMPEDLLAYQTAFLWDGTPTNLYRIARRWELTNTRYLLGPAGALNDLNQQFDPVHRSFSIATRFNLGLKPGVKRFTGQPDQITAVLDPNGPLAVFDYAGALPRAKVYTQWQVSTNDEATLKQLASPAFDPQQTLLVDSSIPASNAGTNGGSVAFVSYAPKDIVFKADAPAPAVLLLNDRFDPNWKVLVDGKPETLLRCNYIMRGVQIPAGQHKVEFRFEPPVRALYVSVAAVFVGLVLLGVLLVVKEPQSEKPSPAPTREKARA